MKLTSSAPAYTRELAAFWYPYKQEGPAHLNGHTAFFSIAVLHPDTDTPLRLHIAVPYVTIEDLQHGKLAAHRQDFDRLMDIVQQVMRDMVEANVLQSGERVIDIVAEPLTPAGRLEYRKAEDMAAAIGASWLTDSTESKMFRDYRCWDFELGSWRRE